jgi:membrane-bound inhibitor of C-type lysozyme
MSVKNWTLSGQWFSLTYLLMLLLMTFRVIAGDSFGSRTDWRAELEDKVSNSANVCTLPVVNEAINQQSMTTGFYTINASSAANPAFVELDQQGKVTLQAQQGTDGRPWLLTYLGGDRYDIATCYQGKAVCLTANNRNITVDECDAISYGLQTWWLKQYAVGATAGRWFMGNDGIGQQECVISQDATTLAIDTCSSADTGLEINRVNPVLKQQTTYSALTFPEHALITPYHCESGEDVAVFYDIENDGAYVRYQGKLSLLHPMIAASGVKYGSESSSFGWWTQGQTGSIFMMGADDAFIESCIEVTEEQHRTDGSSTSWSAQNLGDIAVLTDCTDCEEMYGMTMRCDKQTPAIETTIWMNVDESLDDYLFIIEAVIGDEEFQYGFDPQYFEMLGHHVAVFNVDKEDELLNAMKNGREVVFKVLSQTQTINLNLSKSAIEKFEVYCGWN